MKILMFSESYGELTQTFIRNPILELQKSGNKVIYICNKLVNDVINTNQYLDLYVIPNTPSFLSRLNYRIFKDRYSKFYLKNQRKSIQINKIFNNELPDIVHCHFFNESLFLLENLNLTNLKIHIQFHGYDASMLLNNKGYINAIKKYNRLSNVNFIFVAKDMKNRIEIAINDSIRNYSILHCGIDTDFFRNEKIREATNKKQKLILTQVAALHKKKGHKYVIKALSLLKKKNKLCYEFHIYGDGPERENLIKIVEEYNLSDEVKFYGKMSSTEIRQALIESDVFIHHSITDESGDMEGIPTSIMEAMAMGLPIISTINSGIPELVGKENGILVKEKDVESICEALIRIREYQSYILASREKIVENFSLKSHYIQSQKIYLSSF